MSNDQISLLIAFISAIGAIYSAIYAHEAKKLAEKADKRTLASLEYILNERLTVTKDGISEINLKSLDFMESDDERNKELSNILKERQENHLNAFEVACGNYLNGHIDELRFEETYFLELKNLIENASYNKILKSPNSPYTDIFKAYKKMENRGLQNPSQLLNRT
jgi:hypothetical protein